AVSPAGVQSTRIEAAAEPAVTVTTTPDVPPESGVIVLVAEPPVVVVLIGFAVPRATTLNATGVPSTTLLPAESVTFAVTLEVFVPLHTIDDGEAVNAMAAGTPVTVIVSVRATVPLTPDISLLAVVAVNVAVPAALPQMASSATSLLSDCTIVTSTEAPLTAGLAAAGNVAV